MSETREFHLGAVLSVTTPYMLCPDGIDGVKDLLEFMTEDLLDAHQLRRASDECTPRLLEQHPWLAEVTVPREALDW